MYYYRYCTPYMTSREYCYHPAYYCLPNSMDQRQKQRYYRPSKYIALQADAGKGKYVAAEVTTSKHLMANRDAVGPWETFELIQHSNENGREKISLRSNNLKYVAAELGQKCTGELMANRDAIGPWETFELIRHPDGTISLKADNGKGKYVAAELGSGSKGELRARSDEIGPWEKFKLYEAPSPGGFYTTPVPDVGCSLNPSNDWVKYERVIASGREPITGRRHRLVLIIEYPKRFESEFQGDVDRCGKRAANDASTVLAATWWLNIGAAIGGALATARQSFLSCIRNELKNSVRINVVHRRG